MENAVATLSTDIHVITAEINAYLRSGVYSFMEAGRRLKHAKETLIHGSFGQYARENLCITASQASNLIAVFDQFGDLPTSANLGMSKLFEMLSLPSEIDRRQFVEQSHTIPSTGEIKTIDELTVRELREVKAELKRKQAELDEARRSEQIALTQNERLSDELAFATKPETVVVEKEVERIVEVDKTDYTVAERLQAYE